MTYSHRFFLYAPAGALLLLVLLYSVYWKMQADMLSARLDALNGGEVSPGIVLSFAEKSVGGYPFRLDTVLSGVTLAHRGPEGETAWRTEKLALHAMSYGRPLYLIETTGLQSFGLPPEKPGGPPRIYLFTPALSHASVLMRDGALLRFDMDIRGVDGKEASKGAAPDRTFIAERAQFHLIRRGQDRADIVMQIDGGTIGMGFMPKLGPELAHAELHASISAAKAFAGFETGKTNMLNAIERWREEGGALEAQDLKLNCGRVNTSLQGSLKLDEAWNADGTLGGLFAASDLTGYVMKGSFNTPPQGQLALKLQFAKGDLKASVDSALGPGAGP